MNLHRILANFAGKYVEDLKTADTPEKKAALRQEYEEKKTRFINAYGLEDGDGFRPPYFYNPQKPSIEAKAVIENIETNLSLTSVGIKLKQIARKQSLWSRLRNKSKLIWARVTVWNPGQPSQSTAYHALGFGESTWSLMTDGNPRACTGVKVFHFYMADSGSMGDLESQSWWWVPATRPMKTVQ